MVHIKNAAVIALCLLVLDFAEATKELPQPVRQWDYMHYLQKLADAEPNEGPAEDGRLEEDPNEDKRAYEPLLHSLRGKRIPQGTLLRYMVGGRPSFSSVDGTVGLWKHQSIYKGKRPAHAQLPLLHQLLGYIGKRNLPTDGTFWKLPFGKRLQDGVEFDGDETDNYDIDANKWLEKRGYDEVPLLHYSFSKRSYEPLLHTMLGKRSWNDYPFIIPKTRKNDNDIPLLHQFGFGKRSQIPLLHSMLGKRDSSENGLLMSKRQEELLEHTIDENEDYYLVKRSTNVGPPPYYNEGIDDIESRRVNDADARRWRNFIRTSRIPKERKKRNAPQEEEQAEEQKRGWDSGKMNLDELKNGVWFGKRDNAEEDKKVSPILHQVGSTTQRSAENEIAERNKKSYKFSTQLDKWAKRFGDDIVWGKMYRAFKRAMPVLHRIGTFGKRFNDDIMWDTYTNDVKRNAPLLHQILGKRFGDDITWDTLMNEFKRNQIPLLHQSMGKRFDDDIMWDTFTNGMKRNAPLLHQMLGKRFGDDITWDTFMNERKRNQAPLLHEMIGKRFGDDIRWDQFMNERKRSDSPLLHQLFGKRFDDDITWDTFLNEFKRSQAENLGKRFDDNIVWDTYLNGMKRSDIHEDDKKTSPLLHQLGSFGKKSAPTLHPDDDDNKNDDDKRTSPLLHQIGSFGKKSESQAVGDE